MSLLEKLKSKTGCEIQPEELEQYANERVKNNLNRPLEELTPSEIREVSEYRKIQLEQQREKERVQQRFEQLKQEKKEYYEEPERAFSGNGNRYKLEARNAELERLVGQLYAENEFLKKAIANLGKRMNGETKLAKRRRDI